MKRCVLSPSATRDSNGIWAYIATDSIEAAGRVIDALESAMDKLAAAPGIGHRREELAGGPHRFCLVDSYLIVYRVDSQPLQIVQVILAARVGKCILGIPNE